MTVAEAIYLVGMVAVASMAGAAVLEAGRKSFDMFGMVVIGMAGALGGGTVRDLLLDRTVFWVADVVYVWVSVIAALGTFFAARLWRLPAAIFVWPDALGLALFGVLGTRTALLLGVDPLIAAMMGVITGVMGGVIRDVLCNEEPLVFQGPLYATNALVGTLLYTQLRQLSWPPGYAETICGLLIFCLRAVSLRRGWELPRFRSRG
nr:trimeric intracellular cation channel family protein [Oceanococcus sp. HetDA_MAG_MS8]